MIHGPINIRFLFLFDPFQLISKKIKTKKKNIGGTFVPLSHLNSPNYVYVRAHNFQHETAICPNPVTQTIRQTEIPALPDSWVTNTLSVQILCPQKVLLFVFS